MMARLFGMSRRRARERAAELLELFELTDAADRLVRSYSGGMRRRLDLACGSGAPAAAADPRRADHGRRPGVARCPVGRAARGCRRQGTSLLLTTHYLEEADRLCDRLGIVDRGELVVEGTPES